MTCLLYCCILYFTATVCSGEACCTRQAVVLGRVEAEIAGSHQCPGGELGRGKSRALIAPAARQLLCSTAVTVQHGSYCSYCAAPGSHRWQWSPGSAGSGGRKRRTAALAGKAGVSSSTGRHKALAGTKHWQTQRTGRHRALADTAVALVDTLALADTLALEAIAALVDTSARADSAALTDTTVALAKPRRRP